MYRLVFLLAIALFLSGCGIDSGFERGYIISHSEVMDQVPLDSSVDE
jgi:hypothetical protein